MEKIAAQTALEQAFAPQKTPRAYGCEVMHYVDRRVEDEKLGIYFGNICLKNRITLQEAELVFAVRYVPNTFEITSAVLQTEKSASDKIFTALKRLANSGDINKLQEEIGAKLQQVYPFASFFVDVRNRVLKSLMTQMEKTTAEDFERIFALQYPMVRGLKNIGVPSTSAFTAVAEFVLTEDLRKELEQPEVNINAMEELMEDVRALGLTLDVEKVVPVVQKRLLSYARAFAQEPQRLEIAVKLVEFINYMEIFGFSPDYTQAQLLVFEGLRRLPEDKRGKNILKALARKLKIAV